LPVALEVKYHPDLADNQKLKYLASRHSFTESWLVGRYPAPGFPDFVWVGIIF